nr:hypothetical protein [Tanacetum cinerariifolium]
MYCPYFDSPSSSPQPNQGYSPLNRMNLDMDMENLFNTQDYYASQALGQGSGVRPMGRERAKKKAYASSRFKSSSVAGRVLVDLVTDKWKSLKLAG